MGLTGLNLHYVTFERLRTGSDWIVLEFVIRKTGPCEPPDSEKRQSLKGVLNGVGIKRVSFTTLSIFNYD